jgi:hypothetical protein
MFPNVRLMIAATLASVVALVCGFGIFAVFRVSHEPFVRSPTITASLQLVADNAAYSSVGFDSGVRFNRLQVEAPPSAAIIDSPAATGEHDVETEPPPATSAEPGAGPLDETSSDVAAPTERPTAAVTPTGEAPAAGADAASANDPENVAALSRPAATAETMIDGAREAAPAPETTAAASDQENKSLMLSMADAGPAFSSAAVAVNEPHDVQPPPRERINLTGPPSDAAGPSAERAHKTALKKPKRVRVAVRIRRVQRVAGIQYAPTQFSQTQYTPTTEQNFGSTQMNFQPTPSQAQYAVRPAAPVRFMRLVTRKPRAPTKEPNTATGGPFVSATNR